MFPIDEKTGKLWDAENSNAKLRSIQSAVKARLGKAANADVIQATIVHEWAEFCAQPQDQAAFLKEHLPTVRSELLAQATARRKAAESAATVALKQERAAIPDRLLETNALPEPGPEFKCADCGKVCGSAGALTNHERVHD